VTLLTLFFFNKNVVVRTEQNVVSAISLSNTNKIEWRAIVKDTILSHLLLKTGSVCIAKNSFMAFDNKGSLQWQHMIQSTEGSLVDIVEMTQSQRIAFLSNNTVYIVTSVKEGTIVFQRHFEDAKVVKLLYDSFRGLVILVESTKGNTQTSNIQSSSSSFLFVNERTNEVTTSKVAFGANLRDSLLFNSYLVLGYSDKIIIHNFEKVIKEFNLLSFSQHVQLIPSFFKDCEFKLYEFGENRFIYTGQLGKHSLSIIFDLEDFAKVKVLKDVVFSIDVSPTQSTFLYTELYTINEKPLNHKFTMITYNSESKNSEESVYEIAHASLDEVRSGRPKMIWHHLSEDKTVTHVTIRSIDGSFSLYTIRPNENMLSFIWRRHEALASLESSIVVDLPVDKNKYDELKEEFEKNFFSRTASQLSHITTYFSSLSSKLSLQRSIPWEKPLIFTRDHFGYRKLIISITKNGNVFGLHSTRGTLIWSKFFEGLTLESLYSMRGMNETNNVIVIGKEVKENTEIISWVIELDSLSGNVITKMQMKNRIIHSNQIDLSIEKSHHTDDRIILLVDNAYNVFTYPKSAELANYLQSNEKQISFYLASLSTGVITGYSLSITQDNQVKAISRWSKSLLNQNDFSTQNENENEKICSADGTCTSPVKSSDTSRAENPTASSRPQTTEILHSVIQNRVNLVTPARAKGTGGVLWNYLNPNLIVATTINERETTITLYFIDSVTGRLLYFQTHSDAQGPLNIVMENNWVVYHYWSPKSHCYFMSVIDLYENEPQWQRKLFSSYDDVSYKKNSIQSAFQVFKQTFFFPSSVSSMAVTLSNLGMSNPHILVGLSRNGILALDKRFVDARRVQRTGNQPMEEDIKEGIIPYRPVIDLQPLHLITFNYSVNNIRNIYTDSSHLESTTLVIAHGLDVYFVATSGISGHTFDRLDPNFDTPFLIFVCSVIFVASCLSHYYVKNYNLMQSWK